jgi:DDE family transposase
MLCRIPTAGYPRILAQRVFSRVPLQGQSSWRPQRLAWVALLMAWDEGQTLAARWEHAKQTAHTLHAHWKLGRSYGGFTAGLVGMTAEFIPVIKARLRQQLLTMAGPYAQRCRWFALAADGSRLEAPHTTANEEGLGCAGREKTAPQVFMTTLWHMGTGLPWDFCMGPGTSSERGHLAEMLAETPEGCLLVADAGFAGYELLREIIESKRYFLFRVGGNVTLLTELGFHVEERDGWVYLWPQDQRDQPPLVLRLIRLERGKQTVYLITNVLDPHDLTEDEAATLYEMRWGIEVFYRSYKQTLDRRKLLSRTPATCLAEAQWTMFGLWLLGLITVRTLIDQDVDPLQMSVATARDAVRRAMRSIVRGKPHARQLARDLRVAVKDTYTRRHSKTARNYPRKKREKPPGPPKIKPATLPEIQRAKRIREELATQRRTA